MAKSNAVITTEVSVDGSTITFNVVGAGTTVLRMDEVSQTIQQRAMIHGLVQRVSDAAAIPRDTATGASATPAEKLVAIAALVDHYNSGTTEWNRARTASGEPRDSGLTMAAIMRVKGLDEATAKTAVEKLAATQFAGDIKKALTYLASSQVIASAILDIKRERLAEKFAGQDEVDPLAGL